MSKVISLYDESKKIMLCFVFSTQKKSFWQHSLGSPVRKGAKVSIVDYKDPKNLVFLMTPTLNMGNIADGILKHIKQDFGAEKKDIIGEMVFINELINEGIFPKSDYSLYKAN